MEDTWPAAGNGRCRFSRIDAASSRLHPNELDRRIGDKIIKKPHGIAAAAYAGHGHVGQAPLFFQHLLAHFLANDFLEIADHHGIGMGPHDRANAVSRVFAASTPLSQGFVDGVLEALCPCFNGNDISTKQFHAIHVEGLTLRIQLSHVDHTFKAQ